MALQCLRCMRPLEAVAAAAAAAIAASDSLPDVVPPLLAALRKSWSLSPTPKWSRLGVVSSLYDVTGIRSPRDETEDDGGAGNLDSDGGAGLDVEEVGDRG